MPVERYFQFGLSYCDLEDLLAGREIEVDHVRLYRWVQGFTPCWPMPLGHTATPLGAFVDETYVKIAGTRLYACWAVDKCGQVTDVYFAMKRETTAPTRFFTTGIASHSAPVV